MSGMFIQGLTDPMTHHANQTAMFADSVGEKLGRSEANTMDLSTASFRGEASQVNVQGHENWRQAANLKGQLQAQLQSDGVGQISNHYGQLSMNNVHSLTTVNMPTA
ncbi:hypothetical protein [Kribbella sp. HUAS MG21]|jgi:hypothetical protein|uniref:Uncharacterized protein n=1 Tax=Kribbella sp. HUAS MG21 TaxID=3160966 RepID=A0AAU7TID3_9ACTN